MKVILTGPAFYIQEALNQGLSLTQAISRVCWQQYGRGSPKNCKCDQILHLKNKDLCPVHDLKEKPIWRYREED